jgi:hypothetical protein
MHQIPPVQLIQAIARATRTSTAAQTAAVKPCAPTLPQASASASPAAAGTVTTQTRAASRMLEDRQPINSNRRRQTKIVSTTAATTLPAMPGVTADTTRQQTSSKVEWQKVQRCLIYMLKAIRSSVLNNLLFHLQQHY